MHLWKNTYRLTALIFVIFTMLLSVQLAAAQGDDEASGSPIERAVRIAREAVELQEGKSIVIKKWTFFQDFWDRPSTTREDRASGIDNCVSTVHVMDARNVYHGWTIRITDANDNTYETRVSFDLDAVVICDQVSYTATTTTTEDDSETEAGDSTTDTGDLPAPVAGAGATGTFELGGHADGLSGQAIGAMNAAGMTWVKKQLPMSAGLGTGQSFINDAHANGFKILLGVVIDKNSLASDFDGAVASYSAFVGQLAASGADAIEVHNEPNIDREWPQGQISGASYVQLLAPAFNAIKGANANTLVISGAPAPTGFFGTAGCGVGGCNDDVFMQQMADAGAAQYMDCVGLHYNEGIVSPGTVSGDPRGEYPTYYFGSMLSRGYNPFGGKPVCFSELGYLSPEGMNGPLPPAFGWAGNVTVAQHAAWLGEAATRAAQSGNVRLMIVWNVNFTRFDSDPMGGYAILRPDGSCPACGVLGTVMGG